jgi:4Fe-4S iron sulfur cluster binding proteins, NifH/frxC family
MTAPYDSAETEQPQSRLRDRMRAEAAIEPDPVSTTPPTKTTQVIAIYGKGGIGKSFTLANLSYMMAQQGKRVLLIGCDPKSDTTSLLFGGRSCPTIIETSSKKKLAGEKVQIGDVCFKRDGVFAMELGGPEVGRGCGGRGIIHGFELLEKLGFHQWGFDYVLLDFLGDVVCGGFGLPIARTIFSRSTSPTTSAPRWTTFAGWAAMSASRVWLSTKTTARAKRVRLPTLSAFRFWPRSPPMKTSAARARVTRSSASPVAVGRRCSKTSPRRRPRRRQFARHLSRTNRCLVSSRVTRLAAAWCSSRRLLRTCVRN